VAVDDAGLLIDRDEDDLDDWLGVKSAVRDHTIDVRRMAAEIVDLRAQLAGTGAAPAPTEDPDDQLAGGDEWSPTTRALALAMLAVFKRHGFGALHVECEKIKKLIALNNRLAVVRDGWIV
jgi:hypothetical protein